MIREIASITVKPGHGAAFEAGVEQAIPLFLRAPGCRGVRLERVIERADDYRLIVGWDSVEDHTVRFRQSEDYARWRALVAPCFARPPEVVHSVELLDRGAEDHAADEPESGS